LAEETGRSAATIRDAIIREDKNKGVGLPHLSGTDKYQPVTPNLNNLELSHGGARIGAGRPSVSSEKPAEPPMPRLRKGFFLVLQKFDLWLACHTQEEIAERENVTKETVSQICQKMAELSESDKPVASHLTDRVSAIITASYEKPSAKITPSFEILKI